MGYLRRERACPTKTMPPFLEKLLPYVVFSILALAGVATAHGGTAAAIFIAILVLALLGAAFTLFQKFLLKKVMKSSNSYQINVQSDSTKTKKSGIENAGFDVEKGSKDVTDKGGDKLAGNYVPYGQYPAIPSAEEVKDEKEEVKVEQEKWKGAYVPYQEDNKEESQ